MCSRIFWNDNGVACAASRSLDWAVSDEPRLWFLPRGIHRDGHSGEHTLHWTSRYASVAISMWDNATIDGLNEKGLAAHTLYLNPEDAVFPSAANGASVAHTMWTQYVLDTFASVAEVVAGLDDVAIVDVPFREQTMGAHLAVEDGTGDAAVIEPIGGRLVVHHGHDVTVLTNSPSLDEHLANLKRYRDFGGELPLPGDITSTDRFIRANYFLRHLPEPQTPAHVVAGVKQLIENVAVPFGAPYDDGGVYPTWWHIAADVSDRVYYFTSTFSPNTFWISLDEIEDGTEVRSLDPHDPTLVGDAANRLEPTALNY
jgi:choloylglycine hydrolase